MDGSQGSVAWQKLGCLCSPQPPGTVHQYHIGPCPIEGCDCVTGHVESVHL